MAPEYAMEGLFSVKSDVFSFEVILLEIISGKKNNGFHLSEHGESLLTFAWKLWSKGEGMKLIDEHFAGSSVPTEVLKCIQIGLLCVQVDPANRPTMSTVVAMLGSETITLPLPVEPTFYVGHFVAEAIQLSFTDRIFSVNEVTISSISTR
ncbi:cysteine-rich receptor-like protein kinase 44 [Gossypium arboreum]|uniref:cysteine-rich receptor-like protein kinase 44 n=1 Tax=Gossypium arboreum TaxID=29729 RepID=UPI0022F18AB3|nr:cysteine-rich receptor-like protein kinase 44 [Gossypium arboreum]